MIIKWTNEGEQWFGTGGYWIRHEVNRHGDFYEVYFSTDNDYVTCRSTLEAAQQQAARHASEQQAAETSTCAF